MPALLNENKRDAYIGPIHPDLLERRAKEKTYQIDSLINSYVSPQTCADENPQDGQAEPNKICPEIAHPMPIGQAANYCRCLHQFNVPPMEVEALNIYKTVPTMTYEVLSDLKRKSKPLAEVKALIGLRQQYGSPNGLIKDTCFTRMLNKSQDQELLGILGSMETVTHNFLNQASTSTSVLNKPDFIAKDLTLIKQFVLEFGKEIQSEFSKGDHVGKTNKEVLSQFILKNRARIENNANYREPSPLGAVFTELANGDSTGNNVSMANTLGEVFARVADSPKLNFLDPTLDLNDLVARADLSHREMREILDTPSNQCARLAGALNQNLSIDSLDAGFGEGEYGRLMLNVEGAATDPAKRGLFFDGMRDAAQRDQVKSAIIRELMSKGLISGMPTKSNLEQIESMIEYTLGSFQCDQISSNAPKTTAELIAEIDGIGASDPALKTKINYESLRFSQLNSEIQSAQEDLAEHTSKIDLAAIFLSDFAKKKGIIPIEKMEFSDRELMEIFRAANSIPKDEQILNTLRTYNQSFSQVELLQNKIRHNVQELQKIKMNMFEAFDSNDFAYAAMARFHRTQIESTAHLYKYAEELGLTVAEVKILASGEPQYSNGMALRDTNGLIGFDTLDLRGKLDITTLSSSIVPGIGRSFGGGTGERYITNSSWRERLALTTITTAGKAVEQSREGARIAAADTLRSLGPQVTEAEKDVIRESPSSPLKTEAEMAEAKYTSETYISEQSKTIQDQKSIASAVEEIGKSEEELVELFNKGNIESKVRFTQSSFFANDFKRFEKEVEKEVFEIEQKRISERLAEISPKEFSKELQELETSSRVEASSLAPKNRLRAPSRQRATRSLSRDAGPIVQESPIISDARQNLNRRAQNFFDEVGNKAVASSPKVNNEQQEKTTKPAEKEGSFNKILEQINKDIANEKSRFEETTAEIKRTQEETAELLAERDQSDPLENDNDSDAEDVLATNVLNQGAGQGGGEAAVGSSAKGNQAGKSSRAIASNSFPRYIPTPSYEEKGDVSQAKRELPRRLSDDELAASKIEELESIVGEGASYDPSEIVLDLVGTSNEISSSKFIDITQGGDLPSGFDLSKPMVVKTETGHAIIKPVYENGVLVSYSLIKDVSVAEMQRYLVTEKLTVEAIENRRNIRYANLEQMFDE